MKHIKLLGLALVFVLAAFGCKKKEPEPAQQAVGQKQPQQAKTSTPAKTIETVEQTQPTPTNTQNETAETTTAIESSQQNKDPELIKSLQQAVGTGDVEKIQSIIDKGVDVNIKANSGASLLHIALLGGHEAAAALLISKGIDTHATMTGGASALHFAVLRNCKDIASFLIDDGVDVNAMGFRAGPLEGIGRLVIAIEAVAGHDQRPNRVHTSPPKGCFQESLSAVISSRISVSDPAPATTNSAASVIPPTQATSVPLKMLSNRSLLSGATVTIKRPQDSEYRT